MAYFIPSSIQKRLLRYALSRLEFFDTDALDLDRLEIGWGRKSTVELKDVALRKAKLASLLQLPKRLSIEDATVALLRVTVPADLHTASIVVEIQGVHARVRLLEDDQRDTTSATAAKPSRKPSRDTVRRNTRRAKSPPLRRERHSTTSGFSSDEEDNEYSGGLDAIPTPRDLAASFLAEETAEDKGQLEAAITSQSLDLRQSAASIDSSDDGLAYGTVYGTGVGLSLPAFLADFLKGISDRLQVVINGISLMVLVRLDPSADEASRLSELSNISEATLGLTIDTIKVYQAGESVDPPKGISPHQNEEAAGFVETQEIRVGSRCISIHGITGSLISDAATLVQLSQVFDRSSDGTTGHHGTSVESQSPVLSRYQSQNTFSIPARDVKSPAPNNFTLSENEQHSFANDERRSANSGLLSASASSVLFGDANLTGSSTDKDQEQSVHDNPLAESASSAQIEAPISPLDSSEPPSFYTQSALKKLREERLASAAQSLRQVNEPIKNDSWDISGNPSPMFSSTSSIEKPSTLQGEAGTLEFSNNPERAGDVFAPPLPETTDGISRTPSDDAMLESRIFSHDEAESIYMSAVYDVPHEGSGGSRVLGQTTSSTQLKSLTDQSSQSNETSRVLEHSFPQPLRKEASNEPFTETSGITGSPEDQKSDKEVEKSSSEPLAVSPTEKLISRTLVFVSEGRLWLPQPGASDDRPIQVAASDTTGNPQEGLTRSEYRNIPGAFSMYAESHSSSLKNSRRVNEASQTLHARNYSGTSEAKPRDLLGSSMELSLGSIKLKTDAYTSRLLILVVRKIQSIFNASSVSSPQQNQGKDNTPSIKPPTGLNIALASMEIAFVESVTDRSFDPSTWSSEDSTTYDSQSEKVLFRLNLSELTISTPDVASTSQGRLEIGQLRFGFAEEDIVSFSRETKLRASLRDVREVANKDLSLEINQINGVREIHLATQPITITVDLSMIDSTLGSIGGLSGLLELGSSITSDATVVSPTPKPQPRFRTVRFDSLNDPAPESTKNMQPRVNVRINGSSILLKGNRCKIALQSSAVKLVTRNALIGVKIDDIKLHGPYLGQVAGQAPLLVRLRDTKLTYLFAPEEHDLTRLISLLTPSKDKFEDDDDFLVDTLVRQRKKGSVLRANVAHCNVDCNEVDAVDTLKDLGVEMSRMSVVTKFLPKESRPGLLTLGLIDTISVRAQTGLKLGQLRAEFGSTEVAHVSAPSLVALAVGKLFVERENKEILVTAVLPENCNALQPMLMTRMIEDELEPTVRIKLWNTCFEYSVPTLLGLLDRDATITGKEVADDLTASIANLVERPGMQKITTQSSNGSDMLKSGHKPLRLDIAFRECALGLKPRSMTSKGLFVMTDARVVTSLPTRHGFKMTLDLRKAGLLLINDTEKLVIESDTKSQHHEPLNEHSMSQVESLCSRGYVSVTSISAASISLSVRKGADDESNSVDVEVKDKLFVLETCADSTQTLIETLNDLLPPTPPSKGQKYRTEIAPVEDMMASFTGDAFAVAPRDNNLSQRGADEDYFDDQIETDSDGFGDIPSPELDILVEDPGEELEGYFSRDEDEFNGEFTQGRILALEPSQPRQESISGGFHPGNLPPQVHGIANKWDAARNQYIPVKKSELIANPFKVLVRDTHIIWNLYDGYDWEHTRETITKAVQDVETRAAERRQGKRAALEDDGDDESVIGDFLFNSIYIGVPINHDPKELSRQINRHIDDLVSETASHTQSHASTATSRPSSSYRPRSHSRRKLKLNRSRRHKIAFELRGVSVDFFAFQPGGETQSSTDIRINDFEIFDHVPTSTWKKFATYMHDAGPREDNKPMLHLEICDVRPVPELTATELVIRVTVLPLRLHVDQDALDFVTRFFEFNDDGKARSGPETEQPYLQRVEVRPVPVKLDYKPKKIDYAGLRSGRTTEFMNFFILDEAEFVLKHVVVYGTSGFLKLHRSLEDVWMPDVKKNQLPSVLSGLNGVRTFVNVGTGVRDLVMIPIQEYKKDGRIVRSISKGAMAFAKTTSSELTKFGAKVAIGAQTALQGAEGLLAKPSTPQDGGWEEMDLEPEEKRAISNYANQPTGILQGLKGAARSLERDLLVTKDIIVAISGEVRDSTTAEGAALAVARQAPTLILRPMIGATKAISQALMGATNTVDPQNRRKVEDKYKRY